MNLPEKCLKLPFRRAIRKAAMDFWTVWKSLAALGVTDFLDEAIADGRIRHAGFSFHDDLDALQGDRGRIRLDICPDPVQFHGRALPGGNGRTRYAAKKGLGIIVMEPLRGGLLAKDIKGIREIWQKAKTQQPPSAWALRWVWNHPEVTVVLSGMSTMEQARQNVTPADTGHADSLTKSELALFGKVKKDLEKRIVIPCTGCKYCMPCPQGVNIPECRLVVDNKANSFSRYVV